MKSRKYKYTPQPSTLDQLMNSIGQISALAAVSGYGAIVSSLAAISIIVLSSAIIFPTWFRSDPTGLIEGNPLDVMLGDGLATFDSTGFSALCPSGDLNFCDFVTATNNHFTIIDDRLNTTNGSSISASSVGYNGSTPYYTVAVTDIGAAADDLSTRYYGAVFNFSLTSSRFPALSFPTDQNTVNEDIGRRLRIIETAPNVTTVTTLPATNISYPPAVPSNWSPAPDNLQTAEDQLAARVKTLESAPGATNITSLPAVNITYTPSNSSNWSPAPTELQTAEDQLAARVKALESATDVDDAYTTTFTGSSPQFPNNDANVGSALYYLGNAALALQAQTTQLLTRKDLKIYISAGYGSDVTGDGSASLPVQTLYRAMQLVPNTTNQFLKYTLVFDNGLYAESNHIYFKPNIILSGNEIGTLLILGAGGSFDGGAWTSTGTGYISVLRFALFRCDAACNFDMGAAAPGIGIFAGFLAYNTSFQLNAPMTFARGITGNPFFGISFESVTVSGSNIFFVDLSDFSWTLSGDSYTNIVVNYTSSTTFNAYSPTVKMNGLVNHGSIGVLNYATGLTIDWSIMGVINRDAATLSRSYVAGAFIDVHGDILSLGSINGGLLTTGAGSGSTQYLTQAYGLGYTPANTTFWGFSVPIEVNDAINKLVGRTYALENKLLLTQFSVTNPVAGTVTIGSTTCDFFLDFSTTTQYSTTPVEFIVYPSNITYNGSSTKTFRIDFYTKLYGDLNPAATTIGSFGSTIYIDNGFGPIDGSACQYESTFTTANSVKVQSIFCTLITTLNPSYLIYVASGISTNDAVTFTTCGLVTSLTRSYISITQLI